jgi:hypothetical protein
MDKLSQKCTASACAETPVALLDENPLCRAHFLASAYQHLESIAARIQESDFHVRHGESAARCLEQYMREVTSIACAEEVLSNLERAQVLDILLWASELFGHLRRGPRVSARIPILVRCEVPENPWEEKTETLVLSAHGFLLICRHELRQGETLTCIRLDTGRRLTARVAWVRQKESGETHAGMEFLSDENFWEQELGITSAAFPHSAAKPVVGA